VPLREVRWTHARILSLYYSILVMMDYSGY
jgi:hypothetical protein